MEKSAIMKDIRNNIQQYDFCTIRGDSVFDKEFIFNSFDETFDLKLEIYNQFDVKVFQQI